MIRDRKAKTVKLVQSGYTERVLKTFGMWDCKAIRDLQLEGLIDGLISDA